MTKISQLTSIGDSLAIDDQFLIRDVSDGTTPNKSVTVSGITRALPLGSATAPAIAFASDKNTGIYSPAADTVSISTNGSERFRITPSGFVGIGTTSPGAPLHIGSSASGGYFLADDGTNARTYIAASTSLAELNVLKTNATGWENLEIKSLSTVFKISNTERARIDSSGRLLVGTSVARQANYGGAGHECQINFCGSTINTASAILTRDSNDTAGYNLYFGKTRATSIGGFVNVAQNDELGQITFGGANEGIFRPGAQITAFVDGEPSTAGDTTDMPGRIVFSTTADGASIPTERMRIDSRGAIRTGNNTLYTGTTGSVTASTGTIVFTFDFSGVTTRHTALVKLSVMHLVATDDIAAQPAAEYVFAVEGYTTGASAATAPTAVFQNVYVAATHFAFASTGNTSFTVTLTNPSASAASAVYYKVEVLDNAGALNLSSVTTT